MLIEAYRAPDDSFHWIDVVDPQGNDLFDLSKKYGLLADSLSDCMNPIHLPKYEEIQDHIFIILRAFDNKASAEANTLRELTQKIAIFIGKDFIITIHRRDQPFFVQIRDRWIKNQTGTRETLLPILLNRIIHGIFQSFSPALTEAENKLEELEGILFEAHSDSKSIKEKFLLLGKFYIFRRILRLSIDILHKLKILSTHLPFEYQETKDVAENSLYVVENILEQVHNIINLQLSLASHNTNEIVRLLTIISVFFLPLSFIAGVYGMNFVNIPEVHYQYGYYCFWVGVLILCTILYFFFRRRKWL